MLAATEDVKKAAASRQRWLHLQVSLANALLQAQGHHSDDTQAAFSRARQLAEGTGDPAERFSTYYGLWVGAFLRGEAAIMRETAKAALAEAENWPDALFACVANRIQGATCWIADGDMVTAHAHLERSMALYDPERDHESALLFGQEIGVAVKAWLALIVRLRGEPLRARAVIDEMMTLASKTEHAPTLAFANFQKALFEMMRFDAIRAKLHAEACVAIAAKHGLFHWQLIGSIIRGCAVGSIDSAEASLGEMHRCIVSRRD